MENLVICTIPRDDIRKCILSIETGLEYARECLSTHDRDLGRTTLKNKSWAEHIEMDMVKMEGTLYLLNPYKERF